MTAPRKAGQFVRTEDGALGITTTGPYQRTPSIRVMFPGQPYDQRMQLEDLTVVEAEIVEKAS